MWLQAADLAAEGIQARFTNHVEASWTLKPSPAARRPGGSSPSKRLLYMGIEALAVVQTARSHAHPGAGDLPTGSVDLLQHFA
jgi:hypothetical protein